MLAYIKVTSPIPAHAQLSFTVKESGRMRVGHTYFSIKQELFCPNRQLTNLHRPFSPVIMDISH